MIKLLRDYYPTMFNKPLAQWLGVSPRTLERKAREFGLRKVDNFNEVRADDISRLISEKVKKAYSEGRKVSVFEKGVRNNPNGEFKPMHKFSAEVEERRKDRIRSTFKRRKLLQIYGIKETK